MTDHIGEIDAALLELRISHIDPGQYYGPPAPWAYGPSPKRKPNSHSFRPEYKWQEPTNFSNYRQWSKR